MSRESSLLKLITPGLQVPDSSIVDRITGRRLDPETGKIYHMKYKKPESDEIAKRLVTRSDDTVEKVGYDSFVRREAAALHAPSNKEYFFDLLLGPVIDTFVASSCPC